MLKNYALNSGKNVKLATFDPDDTGKFKNKEEIQEKFAEMEEKLKNLQDKLYASKTHSVLILFQGMDCSGKDGVVKKVLSNLNPQGFRAESFKSLAKKSWLMIFCGEPIKLCPKRLHYRI